MKRHADEAADRALIAGMLPKGADGALLVNPAGSCRSVLPPQIGVVPLSRTMARPQAYKATKGSP